MTSQKYSERIIILKNMTANGVLTNESTNKSNKMLNIYNDNYNIQKQISYRNKDEKQR